MRSDTVYPIEKICRTTSDIGSRRRPATNHRRVAQGSYPALLFFEPLIR